MSLQPIPFFTPVQLPKYNDPSAPLLYKLTSIVDAYFNLTGRVALILPESLQGGSQACEIQERPIVLWQVRLKKISFVLCLLNFAWTFQIPDLTNRRVAQLVSGFPVIMFIAKIVLRSTCRFHSYQPSQTSAQNTVPLSNKNNEQNIDKTTTAPSTEKNAPPQNNEDTLIDPRIKKTLDELLGAPGSFDRLPIYKETEIGITKMTASRMKGRIQGKAFVLIKLRCTSTAKEVQEKTKDYAYSVNYQQPFERLVVLYPYNSQETLAWSQFEHKTNPPNPEFFFLKSFTYIENGEVISYQLDNFKLLQTINKEGKGVDALGFEWEIPK
jgi:hypothetical protein